MAKILIAYATDWGSTKKAAEAVAEGARRVAGTQVTLKNVEEVSADDLAGSDAVILGTPVHMGSPDWRVKKFIDQTCSPLWMKDAMVGKVGAVFATGSGFGNGGGGNELTLLALLSNFAELGMLLVPLPKNTPGYALGGTQWGPYGRSMGEHLEQTGLADDRLEAARHHGANVARVAAALAGRSLLGG